MYEVFFTVFEKNVRENSEAMLRKRTEGLDGSEFGHTGWSTLVSDIFLNSLFLSTPLSRGKLFYNQSMGWLLQFNELFQNK